MSKSRLSEKAKENLMRRNTREKGNKLQPNEKRVLEYKPEQIGLVETEVWSQEDRLFDEMCNSAEIYNANRPYMESSSYGVKISTWFIPTLEDLKNSLFLNNDPGYPYMITTTEDVKQVADFVVKKEGLSSETLGSHIATIIPIIVERIILSITDYQDECKAHGGTSRIFDAGSDRRVLSKDELVKKYHSK